MKDIERESLPSFRVLLGVRIYPSDLRCCTAEEFKFTGVGIDAFCEMADKEFCRENIKSGLCARVNRHLEISSMVNSSKNPDGRNGLARTKLSSEEKGALTEEVVRLSNAGLFASEIANRYPQYSLSMIYRVLQKKRRGVTDNSRSVED